MSGFLPPESSEDALQFPIVMSSAGLLPIPPATLRAMLVQLVTYGTDSNGNQVMQPMPGYTAALPGSLIEDICSTDVGALVVCNQAAIELVNSLTPLGANAFLLGQLGQLFGIPFGQAVNVTVGVVVAGPPGYLIQAGFQVSDGLHTYVTQQTVAVGANGQTPTIPAVATQQGSFAAPAGTVTTILTSVPSEVILSVINPLDGTGGAVTESEQAYRLRVLQASNVACQGTAAFLKTLLLKIPGVVPQQVAVQAVGSGQWTVICGGSNPDPFAIATAIYQAVPAISALVASVMEVASVTQANPGVVTTTLKHGYASGQVVTFSGCTGMTDLNSGSYTATVVDTYNFSIGIDTSGFAAYTGNGVAAPNLRNQLVSLTDYPDIYSIPWVVPPQQKVAVTMVWRSISAVPASAVVSQLAQTAIVEFINEIPASAPINLLDLQETVQDAVEPVVPLVQLSAMTWVVAIDGTTVPPESGTMLVYGDPQGYFFVQPADVTVSQYVPV